MNKNEQNVVIEKRKKKLIKNLQRRIQNKHQSIFLMTFLSSKILTTN
jgi:hypothetical protein